jgi:hypothetical protein
MAECANAKDAAAAAVPRSVCPMATGRPDYGDNGFAGLFPRLLAFLGLRSARRLGHRGNHLDGHVDGGYRIAAHCAIPSIAARRSARRSVPQDRQVVSRISYHACPWSYVCRARVLFPRIGLTRGSNQPNHARLPSTHCPTVQHVHDATAEAGVSRMYYGDMLHDAGSPRP